MAKKKPHKKTKPLRAFLKAPSGRYYARPGWRRGALGTGSRYGGMYSQYAPPLMDLHPYQTIERMKRDMYDKEEKEIANAQNQQQKYKQKLAEAEKAKAEIAEELNLAKQGIYAPNRAGKSTKAFVKDTAASHLNLFQDRYDQFPEGEAEILKYTNNTVKNASKIIGVFENNPENASQMLAQLADGIPSLKNHAVKFNEDLQKLHEAGSAVLSSGIDLQTNMLHHNLKVKHIHMTNPETLPMANLSELNKVIHALSAEVNKTQTDYVNEKGLPAVHPFSYSSEVQAFGNDGESKLTGSNLTDYGNYMPPDQVSGPIIPAFEQPPKKMESIGARKYMPAPGNILQTNRRWQPNWGLGEPHYDGTFDKPIGWYDRSVKIVRAAPIASNNPLPVVTNTRNPFAVSEKVHPVEQLISANIGRKKLTPEEVQEIERQRLGINPKPRRTHLEFEQLEKLRPVKSGRMTSTLDNVGNAVVYNVPPDSLEYMNRFLNRPRNISNIVSDEVAERAALLNFGSSNITEIHSAEMSIVDEEGIEGTDGGGYYGGGYDNEPANDAEPVNNSLSAEPVEMDVPFVPRDSSVQALVRYEKRTAFNKLMGYLKNLPPKKRTPPKRGTKREFDFFPNANVHGLT